MEALGRKNYINCTFGYFFYIHVLLTKCTSGTRYPNRPKKIESTQMTYFGFFQLSRFIIDEHSERNPLPVSVFVCVSRTGLKVNAQGIAMAIIPESMRKHIAN